MSPGERRKKTPGARCRDRYGELLGISRKQGFDTEKIEASAVELCHREGNRYVLKEKAYKPTGAVLGCPLPDPRVTARLWRLALLIEGFIAALPGDGEKRFAFVPPGSYHITLVNRTHFEVNSAIEPMTAAENERVREKILQFREGPAALQLHGLILTRWGRLIVPGYPNGDRFFRLRDQLAGAAPGLRTNLPNTAHIKIGHLLTSPGKDRSQLLLEYVARCGDHIHEHLSFDDVYTPFGRVPLGK